VGRDAEERGEKRRERRVEMNSNGLNEHWTASEARKKREIAIRKDERMKVLDEIIGMFDNGNYNGVTVKQMIAGKFKEIELRAGEQ